MSCEESGGNAEAIGEGGPSGPLYVGETFEETYEFVSRSTVSDATTCKVTTTETPIDFTGYVPTAEILDSSGAVLHSMAVTPSPGDATGTYVVRLEAADNTQALADSAVGWKLSHTLGATTDVLICAPFKISSCP